MALTLVVILSVLGSAGMVAAQEVTTLEQSETEVTAAPGETVELTTTFSVEGLNGQGMQVFLPATWEGTITNADGGAPKPPSGSANVLEVVWLQSGDYEVTYQIDIPENADEGDYTVDVEGSGIDPETSDRIVESTQTTITVEEPDQNTPPTADAGDDQTVDEGDSVTLDASGSSDQDGDSLSYSWSETTSSGVTLDDDTSATPSFTAPDVESETTLTFEVEVSDGNGGTDTDTVDVTVEPVDDEAPTISSFDVSASGQDVDVSFQSDEQLADIEVSLGDDASGTLTESDFSETQSGDTYTYTADVSEGQDGTFSATLDTAADAAGNDGASGQSDSVTVDTAPENEDPSASFTFDPSSPEEGQQVSFDASGSSDDSSIESYEWDFGDGETATGESVTHAYDDADDYDVTLTVTDDDSATDTATQTVSVTEATSDPASFQVSNLSAPDSATQGDNITVSADVTNDGDEEGTQTVEFRLDVDGDGTLADDEALASQAVTLDGDETQTVTFSDLDTSGLAPDNYAHGVFTDDDSATATITIDESEAPAPETSVSLSPESSEVVVGDTETYDVVVDNADGGVGAYEITVSLDDPSVASITDFELGGGPSAETQDVTFAEDNSSVSVTAALANTDDTGSVTIASVTVEGTAAGSSDLSVDVEALGTEGGESYDVTGENGASISVIELGPVGDFSEPPTDADGDGLYEDINGDGQFNIVDVQALFANLDDETVQNNPEQFDFNQDGVVNVVDVQKLYMELLS